MRIASHTNLVCSLALLASACGEEKLGNVPPCNLSGSDKTAYRELSDAERIPFDIVVLVDNSPSMAQEIDRLEIALNDTFANILEESGVDFRVVVVSHHGETDEGGVCIESPLSGTSCAPTPARPVNTERFAHYSLPVGSHDGWCKLLRSYDGGAADEYGLVPDGWESILRQSSMKFFIEMTDDGVECRYLTENFDDQDSAVGGSLAARVFDRALLQLGGGHFGTAESRLYRWYSIVGFSAESAAGLTASQDIVQQKSRDAMGPGTGSQALSVLTGGLRFSVAQSSSFDQVFEEIAEHTIDTVINRAFDCE